MISTTSLKEAEYLRIDGDLKSSEERQSLIDKFNADPSYFAFLLTTQVHNLNSYCVTCVRLWVQVGGVGLTLTGANRVIIYDPSWNPSTDAQAVDRAFRIGIDFSWFVQIYCLIFRFSGQKKQVIVYRLVTCGTVEEKIYMRQVFKNGLSNTVIKKTTTLGYFTKAELKSLFYLDNEGMLTLQGSRLYQ